MRKLTIHITILFVLSLIVSCEKEDSVIFTDINDTTGVMSYVLICNEGPFLTGSGTITMYNRISKTTEQNLFEKVNNYQLGNIVQSVAVYDGEVFIVVNNANRIVVADDSTFKAKAVIQNIVLPRYFLPVDENKAYVSCWDDNVAVVDLNTYEVINSIPVGTGPDKMLKHNNKVFILNIGGFGNDSTISVINSDLDKLDTTIYVSPRPSGIVEDINMNIWIMCSGVGFNGFPLPGDSPGKLICVDPENYAIIKEYDFNSSEEHPEKLVINNTNDILYYLYKGGIYKFSIFSDKLEQSPFIESLGLFYGLGYDKKEDMIYASDPLDYVQKGWVFRFESTNGTVIDSIASGVIPGEFYFN